MTDTTVNCSKLGPSTVRIKVCVSALGDSWSIVFCASSVREKIDSRMEGSTIARQRSLALFGKVRETQRS